MPFDKHFRECTVRIADSRKQVQGTGFFVGSGLIVTCTHVIKHVQADDITVYWQGEQYPAFVEYSLPDPYPDLTFLRANIDNHTCAYLYEAIQLGDPLYSYGYPDQYSGGDSVTVTYEGPSGEGNVLLKLKSGQIRPGMSGAPLLNQRTGGVCGMFTLSRGRDTDLGGRAVPAAVIVQSFADLVGMQQHYHQKHDSWSSYYVDSLLRAEIPYTRLECIVSKVIGRQVIGSEAASVGKDTLIASLGALNLAQKKQLYQLVMQAIERTTILDHLLADHVVLQEPASPEFINFANRFHEWERVVLYPQESYYLFEGPAGYGKTALLEKIQAEAQARGRLHARIILDGQHNPEQIVQMIAQQLRVDVASSPDGIERTSVDIGKAIAVQHQPEAIEDVILLFDVDHDPSSITRTVVLRAVVEQIVPAIYDGLVHNSTYFKHTPRKYRVAFAGRQLTALFEEFRHSYKPRPIQLKPFDDTVVDDICNGYADIDDQEARADFAAHVMFYSGGHPRGIVRILNLFKKSGYPSRRFLAWYRNEIIAIVREEAAWVRASISQKLRAVFDELSVYRRINYHLLQVLLPRLNWPGDEFDLLIRLKNTQLMRWIDTGSRLLSDDITARLLVIRQRYDLDPAAFQQLYQQAEAFYLECMRTRSGYQQCWAVEVLFCFLAGKVNVIHDLTARLALRQQFLDQRLPEVLRFYLQGCDDPRQEYEPLMNALAREHDWEFHFLVCYYLRDNLYDESPYNEMIRVINAFFQQYNAGRE